MNEIEQSKKPINWILVRYLVLTVIFLIILLSSFWMMPETTPTATTSRPANIFNSLFNINLLIFLQGLPFCVGYDTAVFFKTHTITKKLPGDES